MSLDYFLIFCSGFTFAIGGVNFIIGIVNKIDRSYLYFGLLSLFASVFLIAQIPPIYSQQSPSLSNTVSIITACSFYSLFVWFIGEYTRFKKRAIQIGITILIAFDFIAYFLVNVIGMLDQTLGVVFHITILSISIYGIVAGIKSKNSLNSLWRAIYILMMVALFLLTILVGAGSALNIKLIRDPEGFISPLDFFPVFFSIIIGYKMSHDVFRSYQLEKDVEQKDRQWSNLMETINLLIVELDLNGTIVWFNSFFIEFTGYSAKSIIGENWFDKLLLSYEQEEVKINFEKFMKGEKAAIYQSYVRTRNGEQKSIRWSNIALQNAEGNVTGVLSIGADVTEREKALSEIKNLKDQLEKENLILKEEIKWQDYSHEIIGESDALKYVIKRAYQVSGTNSSVLLEGETGVGKELFANLIHQNSMRRHKPFIKVNCASLPKELIESELFGHEKGAFTGAIKSRQGRFELADMGTIFLDEIGELSLDLQPKLLRILQTGEFERIGSEHTIKVDVRVVAATNSDLEKESETGDFRQDLFYRLNVYPITIPPLRQRREDIPILIRHFTKKIGKKIGKKIKHISKADIQRLEAYHWPGNIRELENILERSIITSSGDKLAIDETQLNPAALVNQTLAFQHTTASLEETEKNHIINILELSNWKINGKSGAAFKLGMPPSTLRSKMKKLNIVRPKIN